MKPAPGGPERELQKPTAVAACRGASRHRILPYLYGFASGEVRVGACEQFLDVRDAVAIAVDSVACEHVESDSHQANVAAFQAMRAR